MWWDKATEDLVRWIAEEAPVEISEKCGKLMQWRIPRMWTLCRGEDAAGSAVSEGLGQALPCEWDEDME